MEDKDKKTQNRILLKNSLWRLGQILASGGFTVLYGFIYTVVLAKSDYAVYGVAVTFNYLFQILSNFGFRQSINRFVAKCRGANQLEKMRAYIKAGVKLSIAFSVFTTLVTLTLSFYLVTYFDDRPDRFIIIALVACLVGMAGISLLFQGILEGLGIFKKVMFLNLSCHLVQITVLVFFLLGNLTVLTVLSIETGIMALSIVLFGLPVLRYYKKLPKGDFPANNISKKLLRYGIPICLNTFGGFLYTKVDVLFIKQFLTASDTADYFLMMYIFNFPLLALGAFLYVLNTDVAMCLGQKNVQRILELFRKSIRMGGALGLLMVVLFYCLSFLVEYVLPEYAGCAHLMRLISPMFAVKGISSVASGGFLISMGKVNIMATITILGGCLNVGLNFILIPSMGIDGAVYSTLIGHTLMGLTTFAYVTFVMRALKKNTV